MQCSFTPTMVQQNAEYLRACKVIIKWLFYAIMPVFLHHSLCHLYYNLERGQFYALYSCPQVYFLNQQLLEQRWKESQTFYTQNNSINETAYLDRDRNCHNDTYKWSAGFSSMSLIAVYAGWIKKKA